jgi:hypothetical protein
MSAYHQARRSTSRTAPDAHSDFAHTNGTSQFRRRSLTGVSSEVTPDGGALVLSVVSGLRRPRRHSPLRRPTTATSMFCSDLELINFDTGAIPASSSEQLDPSAATASHGPATAQLQSPSLGVTADQIAMLSALPAPNMIPMQASVMGAPASDFDDMADNGSSSLSELGDASDDQSAPTPRVAAAMDLDDEDSEAETERLEATPRKLTRTATDTSLFSEALYTRTPSKLAQSKMVNRDASSPPTPSVVVDDAALEEESLEAGNPLHSLSLVAASEAASLEFAGRKRKRTSAEGTPVLDEQDEPARKRSGLVKALPPNGVSEDVADSSEQLDVEEELDMAEERLSHLAHEELELEERQATIAIEAIGELATVAKHTKPRKGGRRGKRKAEDQSYAYGDHVASVEAPEVEGDDEHDEEHTAALDEEVTKKKSAIDELAKIEKKFKLFREK